MKTKTNKIIEYILDEEEIKLIYQILNIRSSGHTYVQTSEQKLQYDIKVALKMCKYG